MCIGEKRRLILPSNKSENQSSARSIYDVELVSLEDGPVVKETATVKIEKRRMELQSMYWKPNRAKTQIPETVDPNGLKTQFFYVPQNCTRRADSGNVVEINFR